MSKPEYIFIEIPVLCNSEQEAKELQARVENMYVLKSGFINMLAKAYQGDKQKVTEIINDVSKNPAMAAKHIMTITSLVNKYK